jgi:hypothetical protein
MFLKICYQNKIEKQSILLAFIIRTVVDSLETVGLRIMNLKEGIGRSLFDISYRDETASGSWSG